MRKRPWLSSMRCLNISFAGKVAVGRDPVDGFHGSAHASVGKARPGSRYRPGGGGRAGAPGSKRITWAWCERVLGCRAEFRYLAPDFGMLCNHRYEYRRANPHPAQAAK